MTDLERQQLYREVNMNIRARFSEREDPLTPLDVLCECGTCNELVPTTLGEFDSLSPRSQITLH